MRERFEEIMKVEDISVGEDVSTPVAVKVTGKNFNRRKEIDLMLELEGENRSGSR